MTLGRAYVYYPNFAQAEIISGFSGSILQDLQSVARKGGLWDEIACRRWAKEKHEWPLLCSACLARS